MLVGPMGPGSHVTGQWVPGFLAGTLEPLHSQLQQLAVVPGPQPGSSNDSVVVWAKRADSREKPKAGLQLGTS